jgi:mobilization protein NikA
VPTSSEKGRGRRPREQKPRAHVVKAKVSAAEKASLSAAAEQAGLAVAAYLVQAGLDAAEHRAVPVPVFQQEMLRELVRVRGMVRQAVARLNASGEPGPDLEPAAAYCMRAIRHVDEAAMLLSRRLR